MTWTATGSWLSASTANLTVSNQAVGNLLLVGVINTSNSTVWCTGLSGGGATWTPLGTNFASSVFGFAENFTLFAGKVTATGAGTAVPAWSGTAPANWRMDGHEFHSTVGSWVLDGSQGNLDSASTASWASLTPTASGELYFGFEDNNGAASGGSTSGYVYNVNSGSIGQAYNLSCPSGIATFPVWADTNARAGVMVLVNEALPTAPVLSPLARPLPPGWFPGSAAVTVDPGGIPFYPEPRPVNPSPAFIIPPFPEEAPFRAPLLPPGWFPGADKTSTQPGGIPFYAQPQPTDAAPAVVVVPDVLGEVQWLPWPPNYFPGSQAVSVDPGGIPFYSLPQPLLPPIPPPGPPIITGVSASTSTQAGYFTDQFGQPRLLVWEEPYGLMTNAGRWNGSGGGTWQQDFDNFCSTRAAQGVTALMTEPIGAPDPGGVFANGNTWDNVPPFVTGQDPASGLNPTYWTRFDYLLNSALARGITVTPVLDITYCTTTGGTSFSTWGTTQYQQYGAALGARYKNQPNLMWFVGDDSFLGNYDSFWTAFLTGLRGAGDNHPVSAWYQAEYTSRYVTDTNTLSTWGTANSAWNSCYTYNCGYWIIEYAYGEVINNGAATLLTPAWIDGYRLSGASTYSSGPDRSWRQEIWWCLASGARGITTYATNNYDWNSAGAPASVSTDWSYVHALPNIVAYYAGLTGWNYLLPDLSSALVTAGRGTRIAGEVSGGAGVPYEPAFTNNYVAASKTPDGTLAVLYIPVATTVTVNTALLASGWAASWVDPVSAATSSAGAGPTFNSTAKGSNSQGDPDWVLVFQAPASAPLPDLAMAPRIAP